MKNLPADKYAAAIAKYEAERPAPFADPAWLAAAAGRLPEGHSLRPLLQQAAEDREPLVSGVLSAGWRPWHENGDSKGFDAADYAKDDTTYTEWRRAAMPDPQPQSAGELHDLGDGVTATVHRRPLSAGSPGYEHVLVDLHHGPTNRRGTLSLRSRIA